MTTRKEPSATALYAARLARAYPSLSTYSAASLAHELDSIERAQRRHAERCCSGEDGGYVKRIAASKTRATHGGCVLEHDPDAEARVGERIARRVEKWSLALAKLSDTSAGEACGTVTLQDDPRGRVLLLQLPGEGDPS